MTDLLITDSSTRHATYWQLIWLVSSDHSRPGGGKADPIWLLVFTNLRAFIFTLVHLLPVSLVGTSYSGENIYWWGGGDERPFFVMRTFGGAYKKCPKPGLLKLRTFQTRLKNLRNLNWAGVVVIQVSQKFEVQPARWWCWSRRQCLSRLSSHFRVGMWWSRWTCWTRSW